MGMGMGLDERKKGGFQIGNIGLMCVWGGII